MEGSFIALHTITALFMQFIYFLPMIFFLQLQNIRCADNTIPISTEDQEKIRKTVLESLKNTTCNQAITMPLSGQKNYTIDPDKITVVKEKNNNLDYYGPIRTITKLGSTEKPSQKNQNILNRLKKSLSLKDKSFYISSSNTKIFGTEETPEKFDAGFLVICLETESKITSPETAHEFLKKNYKKLKY